MQCMRARRQKVRKAGCSPPHLRASVISCTAYPRASPDVLALPTPAPCIPSPLLPGLRRTAQRSQLPLPQLAWW